MFSADEPDEIIRVSEAYPEFKKIYEEAYNICRNVEDVMLMFSEELRELDRNTVKYMMDEMQETIDTQKETINAQKEQLEIIQQKAKEEVIHSAAEIMREMGLGEEEIIQKLQDKYRLSREAAGNYSKYMP